MTEQSSRETLATRLGFIMLSAGCAIGLGNVWRFPFIVGKFGGGIFVFLYLFFLLVLGFPVLMTEMAIGRGRLDLGVVFGNEKYAVEVKTAALYAKSPEKAHDQILKYMDGLGVSEGWLVVADADVTKPWDGKISTTDMTFGTKTVHLVRC